MRYQATPAHDALLEQIADAASDALLDDFPTVRHEGSKRLATLCTPTAILSLIARIKRAEGGE